MFSSIRRVTIVTAHAAISIACSPAATTTTTSTSTPASAPGAASLPALPAGCDSPTYRKLDFWLGTWDVTDAKGQYEGTNVIEPILGRCAIAEHWLEPDGHAGDSLFYVDRASGEWRQVFVTDEGPMKEKREIGGAPPGAIRFEGPDRTTLTPRADGTVRQVIEGKRGSWEGIYKRVPKQCDTPEHHQMDFWVGDWKVTVKSRVAPDKEEWTESTGSNHVVSILNGCAVQESFTATGGPNGATWSGKSHSTWMAAEKRWRQTWVDDSGTYLAFTGGMENGDMVLVGEPRPNGKVMRMVFSKITPGHISWRWEGSSDGQKTWRPMMLIEYARVGAPGAH